MVQQNKKTNKYCLILLILLAHTLPHIQSHNCQFHSITQNHIRSTQPQQNQNQNSNIFESHKRRLFSEQSKPLRLTYDLNHFKSIVTSQEKILQLQKILKTLSQYTADIFQLFQETDNLILQDRNDGITESYCEAWFMQDNQFAIPSLDIQNGILQSDLHIYVTADNNAQPSEGEQQNNLYGYPCQWKMDRTTIARLHFNKSFIENSELTDSALYYQVLHQFFHILGFDGNKVKNFRQNYLGPRISDYTYSSILQQHNNIFYINSNTIQQKAQEYFNCKQTIKGIPLENTYHPHKFQKQLSAHWEYLTLKGDIMSLNNNIQTTNDFSNFLISEFTLSFFQDSNWFSHVNVALADQMAWGKDKGCEFLQLSCKDSQKNYPEFSYQENEYKCSFDSSGFGQSIKRDVSESCQIIEVVDSKNNCKNTLSNSSNQLKTSEVKSAQSRCFKSNISLINQSVENQDHRCYNAECTADNKVVITLIDQANTEHTIQCDSNGQEISAPSGYQGLLTCPTSLSEFCMQPQPCKNNCSLNGYCTHQNNKGVCQCNDRFAGDHCQIECNTIVTQEGVCLAQGQTCPSGYIMNIFNRVCEQNSCHQNCIDQNLYCIGPESTDCRKCPLGLYFLNGKCVNECPVQYYQDNTQNICEPCHNSCSLKCTGTTSSDCSPCQSNEVVQNGICISGPCNNGYYSDSNKICQKCHSNCKALCSGPTDGDCKNCSQNKVYQGSVCQDSCNSGFYNDDGICKQCHSECTSLCTGPSKLDCMTCPDQQVFMENQCVSECKQGYYADQNQVCSLCKDMCICKDNADNCQEDGDLRRKHNSIQVLIQREWTDICDWQFTKNDAKVLCKQFNKNDLQSYQTGQQCAQNSDSVFINVGCTGKESNILQCPRADLNSQTKCSSQQCINVSCINLDTLSLTKERNILQIRYEDQVKNVCDYKFSYNEAFVACKQLGYQTFKKFAVNQECPVDEQSFWIQELKCMGSESSFSECQKSFNINSNNCNPKNSCITLECSNESLKDGSINKELGLLLVYGQEKWGQICDDGFTNSAAKVLCKQLGVQDIEKRYIKYDTTNCINREFIVDNLQCDGSEDSLTQCNNFSWAENTNCSEQECVYLNCNADRKDDNKLPDTQKNTTEPTTDKDKIHYQESGNVELILLGILIGSTLCCVICCCTKCCKQKKQSFEPKKKKRRIPQPNQDSQLNLQQNADHSSHRLNNHRYELELDVDKGNVLEINTNDISPIHSAKRQNNHHPILSSQVLKNNYNMTNSNKTSLSLSILQSQKQGPPSSQKRGSAVTRSQKLEILEEQLRKIKHEKKPSILIPQQPLEQIPEHEFDDKTTFKQTLVHQNNDNNSFYKDRERKLSSMSQQQFNQGVSPPINRQSGQSSKHSTFHKKQSKKAISLLNLDDSSECSDSVSNNLINSDIELQKIEQKQQQQQQQNQSKKNTVVQDPIQEEENHQENEDELCSEKSQDTSSSQEEQQQENPQENQPESVKPVPDQVEVEITKTPEEKSDTNKNNSNSNTNNSNTNSSNSKKKENQKSKQKEKLEETPQKQKESEISEREPESDPQMQQQQQNNTSELQSNLEIISPIKEQKPSQQSENQSQSNSNHQQKQNGTEINHQSEKQQQNTIKSEKQQSEKQTINQNSGSSPNGKSKASPIKEKQQQQEQIEEIEEIQIKKQLDQSEDQQQKSSSNNNKIDLNDIEFEDEINDEPSTGGNCPQSKTNRSKPYRERTRIENHHFYNSQLSINILKDDDDI